VTLFQSPDTPPMDNQKVPQAAGPVAIVHGEQLIEERQKGKNRNLTLRIASTSFRGITGPVLRVASAMGLKQKVQLLPEDGASIEVTGNEVNSAQGERHYTAQNFMGN